MQDANRRRVSEIAATYARSTEWEKIIPINPTEKINAEIRLNLNFAYESVAHNLDFIGKFTRGLMPTRWALKLATKLHNKKIFLKQIYKKHPYYESYLLLKRNIVNILKQPQLNGENSFYYGKAGKLAEKYLAFFTGMNTRFPIITISCSVGACNISGKPDFQDNDRTYEFKFISKKDFMPFQYRKAYIQANLSYYLTNEGHVKSYEDIIILELFVLDENIIYRYHLKPDLASAKAAIEYGRQTSNF